MGHWKWPAKRQPAKVLSRRAHLVPRQRIMQDSTDGLPEKLRVAWYEVAANILCIIFYIFDIGSDVWVATYFFSTGYDVAGCLVLLFVIAPAAAMSCLNARWYYMDFINRKEKISVFRWIFRILLTIFGLSPVTRYCESAYFGIRFRHLVLDEHVYVTAKENYIRMLEEDRDATMLRLIEAFCEAGPQLVIQMYIIGRQLLTEGAEFSLELQIASILLSLTSLAWTLVAHHRSVRLVRQDKVASTWIGSILQFLWRFFTVTSRVTTISFFSLAFPEYLPLILCGHVLFATFFTAFTQRTDFCGAEQDNCLCLEAAFHMLVGIIHVFVPFNIAEGRTRFLVCYNSVELSSSKWRWLVLAFIAGTFVVGIAFMLVYYAMFHPNGPRGCFGDRLKAFCCCCCRKCCPGQFDATDSKFAFSVPEKLQFIDE